MRTAIIATLIGAAVVAGGSLWLLGPLGGEHPWVGVWRLSEFQPDGETSLFLIKIEGTKTRPKATVVSAGVSDLKEATLQDIEIAENSLRFAIKVGDDKYPAVFYTSPEKKEPGKAFGSTLFGTSRRLAQIETTTLTRLDPDKPGQQSPAAKAYQKAVDLNDPKKQEQTFEGILEQYPDDPSSYYSAHGLVVVAVQQEAAADVVRQRMERFLKFAGRFGREMELAAILRLIVPITLEEKTAKLGLEYVDKAEQLLAEETSPVVKVTSYRTLLNALSKSPKEKVEKIEARLEKAEESLITPTPPPERKAESNRVVLVELFTGVLCGPCVAADFAFDALTRTYKPDDLILLQYHVPIPGPDPMTTEETVKRSRFYEIQGTPWLFLNGHEGPELGGPVSMAAMRYDELRRAVDSKRTGATPVTLKVTATRKGNDIDMTAEVAGLKKTGDDVRLRFVLFEDRIRFPGGNGQRLHHHVVRSLPGGVDGFPMKEAASTQTAKVNIEELRKSLEKIASRNSDAKLPVELSHLKVVALVQDQKSKEVYQAAQADVPAVAK